MTKNIMLHPSICGKVPIQLVLNCLDVFVTHTLSSQLRGIQYSLEKIDSTSSDDLLKVKDSIKQIRLLETLRGRFSQSISILQYLSSKPSSSKRVRIKTIIESVIEVTPDLATITEINFSQQASTLELNIDPVIIQTLIREMSLFVKYTELLSTLQITVGATDNTIEIVIQDVPDNVDYVIEEFINRLDEPSLIVVLVVLDFINGQLYTEYDRSAQIYNLVMILPFSVLIRN